MFAPTDPSLFFSKNDPLDVRLGDIVSQKSSAADFYLVGYPDDEGIRLNGGRVGAATAPDTIRKILYKMTPPPELKKSLPTLIDGGNNLASHLSLTERHEFSLQTLRNLAQGTTRIISLGGGHDYGYVDGSFFCEKYKNQNALIINFDAHLDVRPNTQSNHSGTPFFRLKEKYKDTFNFVEIGLQPQCNAQAHWNWALERNIDLITLESVESTGWEAVWKSKFIAALTKDTPVFVSFDIDSLCSADAGGCSQAWPTGLKISECMNFLKKLYSASNVRALGIYEVAPNFDFDFKTSKAAALLVHQFIFS